jgi:hypothetical protein
MSAQVYDQLYIFWNGDLLQENTSAEIDLDGDDQDVLTIPKGWAGQTPSPKKTMVRLGNVVPPTGQEVDAWEYALTSKKGTMRVTSGATGKSITSEGFIRKPKLSAGVGKNVDQNFEFHGTPAGWK